MIFPDDLVHLQELEKAVSMLLNHEVWILIEKIPISILLR
jgi:hypothetical protein